MKTLLFIGPVLISSVLMLQMPATPPIKMGLWESTASTKIASPDMPAGMNMPNMTVKVRSCMTPESYAQNLAASQRKDCTRTNETWTAKTYSFDMSCKAGNASGHFDITFESMEAAHAVSHMTMSPGTGHPMQMDMTMSAHFVSSDCGAITPDKPQITR